MDIIEKLHTHKKIWTPDLLFVASLLVLTSFGEYNRGFAIRFTHPNCAFSTTSQILVPLSYLLRFIKYIAANTPIRANKISKPGIGVALCCVALHCATLHYVAAYVSHCIAALRDAT
jgi:hypothetical protein